jgi:hypothetical protein
VKRYFRKGVAALLHDPRSLSAVQPPYSDDSSDEAQSPASNIGHSMRPRAPSPPVAHVLRTSRSYGDIDVLRIGAPAVKDTQFPTTPYEYLEPVFIATTTDEAIIRRTCAVNAFSARRQALLPQAFYPYRDVNKPRFEVALIGQDVKGRTFQMESRPWMLLESGVTVECYGDLVGEWEVTKRATKGRKGKVLSLWRNKATQQETYVRVDDRILLPRTFITRIQTTWNTFKQAIRPIRSRLTLSSSRHPAESFLET